MISRDTVIEFIETHRKLVLMCASAILFICIVSMIVMIAAGNSANQKRLQAEAARKNLAFRADMLFMPVEPIDVSGVLLSRERKARWTDEDAERWYTVPEASSMERLRAAGTDSIEALLESVP